MKPPADRLRGNSVGFCEHCQKYFYASKREAKLTAKRHPQWGKLSAYACPHDVNGRVHLGHLPGTVVHGRADRSTIVNMDYLDTQNSTMLD